MDSRVTVFWRRIDRWQLRPGDHIYSWRVGFYSHHGIYESDSKVIHFTPSSSPTQTDGEGAVISTSLDCFLEGGDIRLFVYSAPGWFFQEVSNPIFQVTCYTEPEDPPETVLRRANKLLKDGFGRYNLFFNNCMHFAIYCKTGHRIEHALRIGLAPKALGISLMSPPSPPSTPSTPSPPSSPVNFGSVVSGTVALLDGISEAVPSPRAVVGTGLMAGLLGAFGKLGAFF